MSRDLHRRRHIEHGVCSGVLPPGGTLPWLCMVWPDAAQRAPTKTGRCRGPLLALRGKIRTVCRREATLAVRTAQVCAARSGLPFRARGMWRSCACSARAPASSCAAWHACFTQRLYVDLQCRLLWPCVPWPARCCLYLSNHAAFHCDPQDGNQTLCRTLAVRGQRAPTSCSSTSRACAPPDGPCRRERSGVNEVQHKRAGGMHRRLKARRAQLTLLLYAVHQRCISVCTRRSAGRRGKRKWEANSNLAIAGVQHAQTARRACFTRTSAVRFRG